MARTLIGCIVANLACIAACGALLLFYPKNSGFTITTSTTTHYLSDGEFLSAALLSILDLAIGVYIVWSLSHMR